jgi:hypothetical protein
LGAGRSGRESSSPIELESWICDVAAWSGLILFCRTQLYKLGFTSGEPLRKPRWLIQIQTT